VTYSGQFETVGDVDWLYFYAQDGSGDLHLRVTKVGAGCSPLIAVNVVDASDRIVASPGLGSGETAQSDLTAVGTSRFAIRLDNDSPLGGNCVGDPYEVTASPAARITTVAPAGEEVPVPVPQATLEPNETVATASGPLAPGTAYGGDFASAADRDWFVFYTTGAVPTHASLDDQLAAAHQTLAVRRLLPLRGRARPAG
jgi:hypothetical protein